MLILEVKGAHKNFGGLKAINDVSLSLEKGSILGLVGPNGSGKTTLFNLISGLLRLNAGTLIFRGEDITGLKPHERVLKGISRTFQVVKPFKTLTVYENIKVAYLAKKNPLKEMDSKIREIVESVGLKGMEGEVANNLPLGNLKMLEIARSLATEPDLLLLDEVFGGLSHQEIDMLSDLIRRVNQQGVSIIIVEHLMQEIVKLVGSMVVLNFGVKIAEGPAEKVLNDKNVIDAYLGDENA